LQWLKEKYPKKTAPSFSVEETFFPQLMIVSNFVFTVFSFFILHSINVDTYIRTSTHPYEYMHACPTSMRTFERLDRLDLKRHEVGQIASRC
jgi:hypothetical protein